MKILSALEQKKADAKTIKHEPIKSINLMERASKRWIESVLPILNSEHIAVFAGFGNNGGDGLAIARLLAERSYHVHVYHICLGKELSPDCKTNLERLPKSVSLTNINESPDYEHINLSSKQVAIDALFGTGLTRPLLGDFKRITDRINSFGNRKIAVDVPSGLFTDATNGKIDGIINADYTITFQVPKLAFLFPENKKYVGEVVVANIDLDAAYLDSLSSSYNYLDFDEIAPYFKPRRIESHKGNFGYAAITKGEESTIGASYLSAKAAFNTGVGFVSLLDFEDETRILNWPELMHNHLNDPNLENKTIAIGPGLGQTEVGLKKLKLTLESQKKPLILDADALNLISKDEKLLGKIPENSILTPHPKELEQLIGATENSFDQLEKVKKFAVKHKIILLIKRHNTAIINSDGMVWFNSTGNNALAKAGSGDVLTGIICGFLAQGYAPLMAAQIGVFVHGKNADDFIKTNSPSTFSPEKQIENLPKTLYALGI